MKPSAMTEGLGYIYAGVALGVLLIIPSIYLKYISQKNLKNVSEEHVEEETVDHSEQLLIYFGSQTGTAEGFAKTLYDESHHHGYASELIDLEEFDAEKFRSSQKAIFVMATYGEGDITDNAIKFSKWLKGAANEKSLDCCEVKFTVFGLGNSQYENFNMAGRTTNEMLLKAGLHCMYDYGEGDDDKQLEEDFDNWKENLWSSISSGVSHEAASSVTVAEMNFDIRYLSPNDDSNEAIDTQPEPTSSSRHFWLARKGKVILNRELQIVPMKSSTRHIEVDITESGFSYNTADNMSVLPENPADIVNKFARCLQYNLEQKFTLSYKSNQRAIFPTPCSIFHALANYLDICGIPRKGVLERFVDYVSDDEQRQRLKFLVSKDGRTEFRSYVTDSRRTLVELICDDFPSIRVPFEHLIDFIPIIQPREYTISCSSSVNPKKAHITVAILREKLENSRAFHGLCSRYLESLDPLKKSEMSIFFRDSSFRLPTDTSVPIILIGPGTGIAPMRALLQEREYQKATGCNILYFGCRRSTEDYIYKDELESYLKKGTLTHLRLAFSRESKSKVYVQDLLRRNSSETWETISKAMGYVYVCGGTAMGNDVHATFTDICVSEGKLSSDEAKKYMQNMHAEGRYIQELWS